MPANQDSAAPAARPGGRSAATPFWWDAAPPRDAGPDGPLPREVDALVVGAGFTGLSAALTLLRGGRSVLVCDRGAIGEGASSRNGGQVGAKLRPGFGTLIARYGEAKAVALAREGMLARAYIEQVVREEEIDCDFTPAPRFQGAHLARDYDYVTRAAELMREKLDFPAEPVPRGEQHRVIASDAYQGGVLDRSTAMFHPGKFVDGLGRRVQAEGGLIASRTEVRAAARQPAGFQVETSRGAVLARNLVVATNGYSGKAFPYFRRRIVPIGSYIIATAPQPREAIDALMPGCRLMIDTRKAASYMRVSPEGDRILYGGRVAARDISPQASGPRLKAVLDHIFPQLRGVGYSHSWMGFTGFTLDDLPHIGEHDGVHYAMGYCGTSGTSLGTYLGHKVGLRVLGRGDASRTAFDDLEFPSHPLYSGSPWFLSAMVAFYRLRDRLGI